MTDEDRIASYRARAEDARRMVADIDAGYRFEFGRGAGPMKDVTAEVRAQHAAFAEGMDDLATHWERIASERR